MKDKHSGKLDPMLLSFMILYQPIVSIQWGVQKRNSFFSQKVHVSPRLPPNVVLRNAWQGQHEDHHQRGTGAGDRAADEGKMEPKIDF